MFVPLKIVTEYSLLKSTIKIDALISFLKSIISPVVQFVMKTYME